MKTTLQIYLIKNSYYIYVYSETTAVYTIRKTWNLFTFLTWMALVSDVYLVHHFTRLLLPSFISDMCGIYVCCIQNIHQCFNLLVVLSHCCEAGFQPP